MARRPRDYSRRAARANNGSGGMSKAGVPAKSSLSRAAESKRTREREGERAYIHIQRDGERQGRRANAVLPLSNENLWPSASKRGRRRHASDGLI